MYVDKVELTSHQANGEKHAILMSSKGRSVIRMVEALAMVTV